MSNHATICSLRHKDSVVLVSFCYLSLSSIPLEHLGPSSFLCLPSFSHIHVALLTLIGIRRLSIRYRKDYLNLLLEKGQDLVTNLRADPSLDSNLIAQL